MHRFILICLLLSVVSIARGEPELTTIETKYYVIHTDIAPQDRLEVELRVTRMAEEYHNRTRDFAGEIKEKLPFYLFQHMRDYRDAGGMPGSAGVYTGERLMAVAGEKLGVGTWHAVQHEGFHQFAHSVIGGDLPIWVNEGLAEYFGEAIFTGDSFVSGVIPHFRMVRVRQMIQKKRYQPIDKMMLMSHEEWNAALAISNYDQAWSMVHFLAHAENGKYQAVFAEFIRQIGRNRPWKDAWKSTFGDIDGFENKWAAYWLALPDNPTMSLYGQAATAALTSFLARATAQNQVFGSFDQFMEAGKKHQLMAREDEQLPPALFDEMSKLAEKLGEWRLEARSKSRSLTLQMTDGTRIIGTFRLKTGGRVEKIQTEVVGEKPRR